ncbi:unnamed protein product [Rotaria sp. Silwood2]|nr:unnamed protein product [Rotaria sp. Silwood2]
MKEIVRQGINDDKPMFDDEVFIHYVGSELDGKIFLEVIQAWKLGVTTMKREEIARFFFKPKYAYGLKGDEKIFRSATSVIFEIELLDFVGKDLSDGKDGNIIRRIIRRGEERESSNEDATVEINLKGIVERALYKMSYNEYCQLDLKAKALQGLEKFSIPMDESVQYEVILIKFEPLKEKRLLDAKQKLEQSELLKPRADDLFKVF